MFKLKSPSRFLLLDITIQYVVLMYTYVHVYNNTHEYAQWGCDVINNAQYTLVHHSLTFPHITAMPTYTCMPLHQSMYIQLDILEGSGKHQQY